LRGDIEILDRKLQPPAVDIDDLDSMLLQAAAFHRSKEHTLKLNCSILGSNGEDLPI